MLNQRKKLWYLWASGSLLVFILLLWFTFGPERSGFSSNASYIWGVWFTTIIVSNLLIIVSTFVLEERVGLRDREPVSSFLFRICFAFSLIFLLLPLIAFLNHTHDGIEAFKTIGTICFVVEPLLAVTLGTFFYGDNIKEYIAKKKGSDSKPRG